MTSLSLDESRCVIGESWSVIVVEAITNQELIRLKSFICLVRLNGKEHTQATKESAS